MTLVEILIVMAIIVLVLGGVVLGGGQVGGARLRQSASLVTGAIKVAYTRATATSKSLRLVMDFNEGTMWLEEADRPMLAKALDKGRTGGAEAVTESEQAAIKEGESIIKGPPLPKPQFHPVESGEIGAKTAGGKYARPLARGIKFRSVQTAHDDAARTEGRGYLYFWPGGQTERATIQLRIGDSEDDGDTVSLLVSPLTGKVSIKDGPQPLELPKDDKEASEREDTGF